MTLSIGVLLRIGISGSNRLTANGLANATAIVNNEMMIVNTAYFSQIELLEMWATIMTYHKIVRVSLHGSANSQGFSRNRGMEARNAAARRAR